MAPRAILEKGTSLVVGSHQAVIQKYLASGSFGHVYTVTISPPHEGAEVACLKQVVLPDKQSLNSMRAEVDVMKQLKTSRNIVQYYDSQASRVGTGTEYEVLVLMEYCPGKGLLDFMNARLQEKLTEPQVLQILHDVALGVAAMHYLPYPLIHRDLKIENVLITADGRFKVCDFGSACPVLRVPRNHQEFHLLQVDVLSHTTEHYRAPEMVDLYRLQPIDEKSDIWALGVFLYKTCYYTTPFESTGVLAILHAAYSFPDYPVYSRGVQTLIAAMLQENPAHRPNIYQVVHEVCRLRGSPVPIPDKYGFGPYVARTGATGAPQNALVATPSGTTGLPLSHVQPQQLMYPQELLRGYPAPPAGYAGYPQRTAQVPHAPQAPQAPHAPQAQIAVGRAGSQDSFVPGYHLDTTAASQMDLEALNSPVAQQPRGRDPVRLATGESIPRIRSPAPPAPRARSPAPPAPPAPRAPTGRRTIQRSSTLEAQELADHIFSQSSYQKSNLSLGIEEELGVRPQSPLMPPQSPLMAPQSPLVLPQSPDIRNFQQRFPEAGPDGEIDGLEEINGAETTVRPSASAGGPSTGPSTGPSSGPINVPMPAFSLTGEPAGLSVLQNPLIRRTSPSPSPARDPEFPSTRTAGFPRSPVGSRAASPAPMASPIMSPWLAGSSVPVETAGHVPGGFSLSPTGGQFDPRWAEQSGPLKFDNTGGITVESVEVDLSSESPPRSPVAQPVAQPVAKSVPPKIPARRKQNSASPPAAGSAPRLREQLAELKISEKPHVLNRDWENSHDVSDSDSD